MADLPSLIAVARGDQPADLLFTNARIVNVFTGEIETANVAVAGGRIAGIGEYQQARTTVDLRGRYLAPGLIDGHVHVESSYLHIDQYARAVVPRGTLAVVTDLHEITNVAGIEGLRAIREGARRTPLTLFVVAPPCVPATHMETSGASLGAAGITELLQDHDVIGLGEMMNFPAVIRADADALAKLAAADGMPRDGHAPRVRGHQLNAYLCPLIGSDHETTELEEGREKLRRGMYLMIREGSSEKNLETLLPLVTDQTYHRCMFVVDDRTAADLLHDGDVDAVVRKAIRLGLDPVRAITLATLTPATWMRLEGLGAIAPGYHANLLVLDDLATLSIRQVYARGELVAEDGTPLFDLSLPPAPALLHSMNVRPFIAADLAPPPDHDPYPVIEVLPGQIVTGRLDEPPPVRNGRLAADPARDLLKLAVIERHHATGNIGIGLVRGFGLRSGAVGSSFAHDSHNIIVVGVDDADIEACAKAIIANGGGLAVADGGRVLDVLPLPIAGLLSEQPLVSVAAAQQRLEQHVRDLGSTLPAPFAVLSFLALPVIPELKLTDFGLVDVMAGRLIEAGRRV